VLGKEYIDPRVTGISISHTCWLYARSS